MPNDFKLAKAVRLMLTRLRIDSTVVNVQISGGVMTLTGRLERPYAEEAKRPELNVELLHEMDRQLRRVEGIYQINYMIENWVQNSDGHWARKRYKNFNY